MKVAIGVSLSSLRASITHMNCASQYFCLARASSVQIRYGRSPSGQQVWLEPGNGGAQDRWPTSFMLLRSEQSITEMPPPHHAQYMRLPRMYGGPCSVVASSGGWPASSSPELTSSFIQGRPQMLTTSGSSGFLMSSVQITRFFQPGALFGSIASLRLLST